MPLFNIINPLKAKFIFWDVEGLQSKKKELEPKALWVKLQAHLFHRGNIKNAHFRLRQRGQSWGQNLGVFFFRDIPQGKVT